MSDQSKFTTEELVACVTREVALRKSCYCKWAKVATIEELTPGKQKEIAMMEAVAEKLIATKQSEDFVARAVARAAAIKE